MTCDVVQFTVFIWTANHVDGCYSEMHSLNMFIERENVLNQLVGIQTDWKWRQASKEIGENFRINVSVFDWCEIHSIWTLILFEIDWNADIDDMQNKIRSKSTC